MRGGDPAPRSSGVRSEIDPPIGDASFQTSTLTERNFKPIDFLKTGLFPHRIGALLAGIGIAAAGLCNSNEDPRTGLPFTN